MLIRPFYVFFSQRGLFLLIGAPRPFYAYQSFLCLSMRTVHFMLVRLFYAHQQTSGSRNNPFLESGLSGLIFLSRQKNKWSLLNLPVLYSRKNATSMFFHELQKIFVCCRNSGICISLSVTAKDNILVTNLRSLASTVCTDQPTVFIKLREAKKFCEVCFKLSRHNK